MSDFQVLDQQALDPVDELEEIGGSTWSWQTLIKPSVTVAVGLHLLLLIVPIIGSQSQETSKQKKPDSEPEKVKLTTLSADTVLGSPAPSTSTPKALASDGVKPSPVGAPAPSANKIPEPQLSASPSPKSSASTPSPKSSTPSPKPSASTPTPSPSTPSPKPSASTPTPSPSTPSPTPSTPSPSAAVSGIPPYPNSNPGAFGIPELSAIAKNAKQTTDDPTKVEKYYQGVLPSKGLTMEVVDDAATKKTIKIAGKTGAPQFLTLFKVPQGTVMVPSDGPLPQNLADTAQLSPEEQEFDKTIETGNGAPYAPGNFKENMFIAQSNSFEPENQNMLGVQFIPNQTEEQAHGAWAAVFGGKGFQVNKGSYGGSVLVTVKKGSIERYFSLVAATSAKTDGAGVYVIGWKKSPGS